MSDVPEYLEKLDSYLDGDDEGSRPRDVLAARGVSVRRSVEIGDDSIGEELWRLLEALEGIGFFVEFTDHLSDRELYGYLEEAISEPTFLMPEDLSFACHTSPIGGYSEEDLEIHYTYYADDEERARVAAEWPDEPLPERKPRPYDRDRFLPTPAARRMMLEEPAG
jgi:hypothetical protein